MRTIIVCHSDVQGGAESYLVRLYGALNQTGSSAHLVGQVPTWSEAGLSASNPRLSAKWGLSNIIGGLLRLPSERRRIRKSIEDLDADIFHLQFKREQIGMTRMLARSAPVVWTEHGRWPDNYKGRILAFAYRRAARSVSSIICVSDDVAMDVRRIVGPGTPIEVVPIGIDTNHFSPATQTEKIAARSTLGMKEGDLVGLWVGRLHKNKRPDIIEGVALSNKWPGTIVVAGQGPELARFQGLSTQTDGLQVLGHVEDTLTLYQAADILFFTSVGEGYPTTIVEASSCGVPTVTHTSSGAAVFVSAAGGVVISDDATSEEWIASAVNLARGSTSASAAAWGAKHGLEDWALKHKAIFDSVVDSED